MSITIHRGANHIGGCVTEISTEKARVFIDLGADLTDDKEKAYSEIIIDGLTAGNTQKSHLLLTHYHEDHIGRITQAIPGISIHIGETAKKIAIEKTRRLAKIEPKYAKELEYLEKAKTFKPKDILEFEDIKVTAFMTDHSAFDAYSFLIEANGKRIFYTGDFRMHGLRGVKMLKKNFFGKYVKDIDYLICEGTNISRKEKAKTEYELMQDAKKLFAKYKSIFILCSSTNIDRIFAFYNAYKEMYKGKRPFICDEYQEKVLKIISENHGEKSKSEFKSKFYNYEPNKTLSPNNGYCGLIRCNFKGKKILEEQFKPGKSLIIYSMWEGYLDEKNPARDEKLIEFLKPYKGKYKCLHTSGHADVKTIQNVVNTIKPKHIIPIHTENREEFKKLFENALLETHYEL
jgi:ribonuclease J